MNISLLEWIGSQIPMWQFYPNLTIKLKFYRNPDLNLLFYLNPEHKFEFYSNPDRSLSYPSLEITFYPLIIPIKKQISLLFGNCIPAQKVCSKLYCCIVRNNNTCLKIFLWLSITGNIGRESSADAWNTTKAHADMVQTFDHYDTAVTGLRFVAKNTT